MDQVERVPATEGYVPVTLRQVTLTDKLARYREQVATLAVVQHRIRTNIIQTQKQLQESCQHTWIVDRLGSFHNTVYECHTCGSTF